jgi:hypothetical protein
MPTLYSLGNAKMVGTASARGVAGVKSNRSAAKGEVMKKTKRERKRGMEGRIANYSLCCSFSCPLTVGYFLSPAVAVCLKAMQGRRFNHLSS